MSDLREANLRSLRARFPHAERLLRAAEPSDSVSCARARSGDPVPLINRDGSPRALHSRVDPRREAARSVASLGDAGYFVVLGLGAGYHLHALIERNPLGRFLVIDFDPDILSALAVHVDYTALFSDPRVTFLLDPMPEEAAELLISSYLPAVHAALRIIPLRARVDGHPRFDELSRSLEQAVEAVARDFTVQSAFGKLWFRNILSNLPQAERAPHTLPRIEEALVVGAGPSLDAQIERIEETRKSATLIAADATLPALLGRGIKPDIVLTIDSQIAGYRHFLGGLPPSTTLAASLDAPPPIVRRSPSPLLVAGSHPLARYFALAWRRLPFIDTSGGNVGHAALSFALNAGARRVTLFGLDFSYPSGKLYARGCHLYPYFAARASRFLPVEASIQALLFRNPRLGREVLANGVRYRTDTLDAYREHLEVTFGRSSTLGVEIVQAEGEGTRIAWDRGDAGRRLQFPQDGGSQGSNEGWRDALSSYRDRLAALQIQHDQEMATAIAEGTAPTELLTLLPIGAWFRAHEPSGDVIARAREWALTLIDRRLAGGRIQPE